MEYLILGLLLLSPMTGYELQKFIKQNLSLICSHSAGSVQTALRKLEKEEKIAAAVSSAGKRQKKTYSITEEGRAAFSVWVAQPMQADKVKNMELSRLFFLGLASPEDRIRTVRDYIGQMEKAQAVLTAIRERFEAVREEQFSAGNNWDEILRFQGYTIAYGIAAAQFEKDWYSRLLCELEESL